MQEHLHTVALPYAADVPTLEEKCEYSIPVGACVVLSEPFVSDYALKEFALWNWFPNVGHHSLTVEAESWRPQNRSRRKLVILERLPSHAPDLNPDARRFNEVRVGTILID